MSRFKNKTYEITPGEPSELFLKARNAAGLVLQNEFNKRKGKVAKPKDYKWIKAELTYPSFDHLTFGHGNQVFSVLVELLEEGKSYLTDNERSRFIKATEENHLVPCIFRIALPEMKPVDDGWNLIHISSGRKIDPEAMATDEDIPMSEWELRNFAIQIVRNHITQEKGGKVMSFCDVMEIDPQIWFEDCKGQPCWVVVRHLRNPEEENYSQWIGLEKTSPQLTSYDGFFAGVFLASSAAILRDLQGRIIPPSERFTGKAPLYRGDQFNAKFKGLQRIYVAP